ncbi:MAG TPA: circadian clock protein KaiC [Candidatus Altiarchaeales archaeon]|nr:circadian clock protein KaiC [Candidatus Altiarchaeales archaeon]
MDKQLSTGIKNLDSILNGGIPEGHCVLVAGSCGTGKTILSQQFLFEGAKLGENGVYFSLTEPREKMIKNMRDFSFFDENLIESGKIKIVDVTQDARLKGVGLSNVQGLINIITDVIESSGAKRIVIDSITALCENLEHEDKIRDFIFELNFQLMYLGCTNILISEIPPQEFKYSIYGVEEFIADGVILLTEFERKGDLIRALQVIKMRGLSHSRNKHVLKILEDGVTLVPLFKADME